MEGNVYDKGKSESLWPYFRTQFNPLSPTKFFQSSTLIVSPRRDPRLVRDKPTDAAIPLAPDPDLILLHALQNFNSSRCYVDQRPVSFDGKGYAGVK
jgi:hypothetical protein